MRMFIPVVALLATLGVQTSSPTAMGAGDSSFSQLLEVSSTNMNGATFTAPEAGVYHFTVVSGAFCYLPLKAGETSPYGGWLTQMEIHTKAVEWGNMDQWGKHPMGADAVLGDPTHHATSTEAATAGSGSTATLSLEKGTTITILVSDGSSYYGDNMGVMEVGVYTSDAPPVFVAPAVSAAQPAVVVAPAPTAMPAVLPAAAPAPVPSPALVPLPAATSVPAPAVPPAPEVTPPIINDSSSIINGALPGPRIS